MTHINAKSLATQDQQTPANLFVRNWQFNTYVRNTDIAEQLAVDTDILKQIANGDAPDTFRLWSSQPSIVVSTAETRLPHYKSACEQLKQEGWRVLPRPTGGTAFPQACGIVNVSAICALSPEQKSITKSYQDFCEVMIDAFSSLGVSSATGVQPKAFCDGDYNILVDGKKLVGTAQRWQQSALLAHAAIFFNIDKSCISDAINLFYRLSGSDKQFAPDVLIDLQGCVKKLDLVDFDSALRAAFSG